MKLAKICVRCKHCIRSNKIYKKTDINSKHNVYDIVDTFNLCCSKTKQIKITYKNYIIGKQSKNDYYRLCSDINTKGNCFNYRY
jgi:hypothetical protein